jgi:peptidoglycan/xylan/chitin deacetylase (PgdA/CDA1 family)
MITTLLLSFDLEEYDKAGDKGFALGYTGAKVVQNLLQRQKVTATFFVTGSFYKKYPNFVKELSETHEIAYHGLEHGDDYCSMPGETAFQRLLTGKSELEKGLHMSVKGFRAPRMRPPSRKILKKAGFLYSSSLHPTYVPGRYNHFTDPRKPFTAEGVLEIPVSVAPVIRLPVSWVWFRLGGVMYAKVITSLMDTDYLAIYFHPWEFTPLQKGGVLRTRNTGLHMERTLEKFLVWITSRAESKPMVEYAQDILKL